MSKPHLNSLRSLFVAAAAVMLLACGSESSSKHTVYQEPRTADVAVAGIIDHNVIPAAENFYTQAAQLDSAAQNFCAAINQTSLARVQNQWKQTSTAWYRLLPFNFGPMINDIVEPEYIYIDALRQRGINNTESIRADIRTMMDADTALTPADFLQKGNQLRGLLALEILLFEHHNTASNSAAEILDDYTNSHKCAILSIYSTRLAARAESIVSGWTSNYKNSGQSYRDLLINGGLENITAEDGAPAAEKLIIAAQEYFDYVPKRLVLDKAAQLSGNIYPQIMASVAAVEQIVEGQANSKDSFATLLTENSPRYLFTIRSNIQRAKDSINEGNNADIYAAFRLLDGNMKRELKDGIGIGLGLSFSDGD